MNSIGAKSTVSGKNNQFYDCVKEIKVEQNDLDKMHTVENNNSIKQNKSKNILK